MCAVFFTARHLAYTRCVQHGSVRKTVSLLSRIQGSPVPSSTLTHRHGPVKAFMETKYNDNPICKRCVIVGQMPSSQVALVSTVTTIGTRHSQTSYEYIPVLDLSQLRMRVWESVASRLQARRLGRQALMHTIFSMTIKSRAPRACGDRCSPGRAPGG